MVALDCTRRRAMVARMLERGMARPSRGASMGGRAWPGTAPAERLVILAGSWEEPGRARLWRAVPPVGRAVPPEAAASTSRRMMRPEGPEPWRAWRSTPDSAAILRARGEAKMRAPLLAW